MAEKTPAVEEVKARALEKFAKEFGRKATLCVCAPGRVNLIGEHTDYNEGFVLPMALPMVTVIAGGPNHEKKCSIISVSDAIATSKAEFDVSSRESIKPGEPKWANYMKGCIANFKFSEPQGFDAVVVSAVPVGAGLSSSAALEVATYTFLEVLTGNASKDPRDKAVACQRAEHEFAGVPCGIMDQFISTMGQEGHALLLDCKDLSTVQIPMEIGENVFLITNSNAPHKLSSSAYCERRDACYEAAKKLGFKSLREATPKDLEVLKTKQVSEEILKRARHVIGEIERTRSAATALQLGDFSKFGRLMNESHDSLRDDYEVSSRELDILVTAARSIEGVLGSRLTGAGFGGCTVTLLRESAVDLVIKTIKEKYDGKPSFYIAKPSKGARKLEIDV